jgi:hypothetical protein
MCIGSKLVIFDKREKTTKKQFIIMNGDGIGTE